ncbi:flavodoxin domain-containing protein [Marispirochaeta sp.]|uniref:flavodoxin domain-containing protein n=1 Tax=Marispirochaeta sp. TaxID=2038653 RepID=UPI0029C970D6|nr:flavodoxin domain-containing protein [Marispirochaeta sp.]
MKGIILYKSRNGATRQYAQWLEEETGFPALELAKAAIKDIKQADIVIFGCPVLANSIPVSQWIRKKWNVLKSKRVVLYTTSGALPQNPQLRKIFESSFEPEISGNIQYFPQGGRMIFKKLNRMDKILMRIGQAMEKNPVIKEKMLQDKDNVDRDGIKPILQYVM